MSPVTCSAHYGGETRLLSIAAERVGGLKLAKRLRLQPRRLILRARIMPLVRLDGYASPVDAVAHVAWK